MIWYYVDPNIWNTVPVSKQKMAVNNRTKQIEQTEAEWEVIEQNPMNVKMKTIGKNSR
jgi:hypothetical protein